GGFAMTFPYEQIFEEVERTLLAYGSKHRPHEEIPAELDKFKNLEHQQRTDDEFFWIMTQIVFYSGFKAATVDEKIDVIRRHFPNVVTVSGYTDPAVKAISDDKEMIRNAGKIKACVHNAKVGGPHPAICGIGQLKTGSRAWISLRSHFSMDVPLTWRPD